MALGNDVTLKVGFDIDKFNAELKRTNGMLSGWASNVTKTFAGIAVFQTLKNIGTQMIAITSEFQKFEAILTNTLGSNSEAQKAMKQIEQFAVNTPFEVSEITAAYVRWANMGLDPTIDRMGKLGDVASSLGAGFEQTAEAFKDLMVGQTKRIEEVGISAQQANGKIQLSFKGVNIEIEKNAAGVQRALDVFSQLNGVLGTSDAISKTLGGKISNLNDAWDIFLKTLGNGLNGPLTGTVTFLSELLNTLSGATAATTAIEGIATAMNAGAVANRGYAETIKKIVDENGLTITISQLREMTSGWANQNDVLLKLIPRLKELGVQIGGLNTVALGPAKDILAPPPGRTEYMNKMTEAIQKQAKALEDYWKARQGPLNTMYVSGGKLHDSSAGGGNLAKAWSGPESVNMPGQMGGVDNILATGQMEALQQRSQVYQQLVDRIKEQNDQLKASFESMAASAIISMAEAFGSGDDIGKSFLKALAKFAAQFGALLISIGIGNIAIKNYAEGAQQIAAGAALVAGGAALSSALSRDSGGGVSGLADGRAVVGGNSQSSAGAYNVTFKIKGSDLIGAMDSASYDNRLRKGG